MHMDMQSPQVVSVYIHNLYSYELYYLSFIPYYLNLISDSLYHHMYSTRDTLIHSGAPNHLCPFSLPVKILPVLFTHLPVHASSSPPHRVRNET